MDFKNSDITTGPGITDLSSADAVAALESAATLAVALQAGNILPLTADGQLILPAGVGLDDIKVSGRNLVIQMPDGTQMIVPDGAVFVPQIVVDGVAVPPLNIAALLIGQEPVPAAGRPQSSGGNFADPEGDIGDPFALGDLLPPTQLAFPEPEEREIVPDLVDEEPTTIIVTPDQPAGSINATASVQEAALPARGAEPSGSNPASTAETTTGSIVFDTPDGLASITLNGVAITAVGQTFVTPLGTLTITSIAAGNIGYSYTLTDNTTSPTSNDVFAVVVADSDGDTASANLTINIVDDTPTARNDTDGLPAGSYAAQTGNVMTGVGTTSGNAGADTQGADGAAVSGARAGTAAGAFAGVGTTINGQYGTLTIAANGNYTYTRNAGTPGGVNDVFTYQITDGDGDTSTATLTIAIADLPPVVTQVPTTGEGTIVNESGLPPRGTEPPGSNAAAPSESTSGTITFTPGDAPATVSINDTTITGAGQVITVPTGTLTITSYNPTGTIGYTFTLNDNTSGDTTSQTFTVTVTDADGDTDSEPFTITIVDDVPTARNDSATQESENTPVTVNVIGNDTQGADGVSLTSGVALVAGSLSGTGSLVYNNDGTFTYTPGPGEEGVEGIVTFRYTITDGDGDQSTATVTINLLEDSVPAIEVGGERIVDEAGLPPRGSEPQGSGEEAAEGANGDPSETTTGTIGIFTGNDTVSSLKINNIDVTNGGTVTTARGVLTVTVADGNYSYSYTLTDNTAGEGTTDTFDMLLTDSDGDTAPTTLVIDIADDEPIARPDTDSIAAGEFGPATGNVITDAEGDGGRDTSGADGITVTGISDGEGFATPGTVVQGSYGKLTLNGDGSYSYVRDAGTPGGVNDVFTYQITDGDGDVRTTTLTIAIGDSTPDTDVPAAGGATTTVYEAGLPARNEGESEGSGEEAAAGANGDPREAVSGTIAFTSLDGISSVTLGGTAINPGGLPQTVASNATGTLVVTNYAFNPATGQGTIGYTYTIADNTSGDAASASFPLVVNDADNNSATDTLTINIIDDAPTARADVDSVKEDAFVGEEVAPRADGNVISGSGGSDSNTTDGVADTKGADGATVTGVVLGNVTGPVSGGLGGIPGTYGTLALNADGSYTYTLNNADSRVQGLDGDDTLTEVFTYTITDGDGDPSTTTLTITINGSDDPITINGLNVEGPELTVDEDDLADGSDPAPKDPLTQTGTFTVNGTDGIASIKIGATPLTLTELAVNQKFTTAYGEFEITAISAPANGTATSITVSYKYTLFDNTAHQNAAGQNFLEETFSLLVTDTDGSTDSDIIEVRIVDDVPTAADDTDTVAGGSNAPATGNVITDAAPSDDVDTDAGADVQGADGATVISVASVNIPANSDNILDASGNYVVNGEFGVLTIKPDGSYSYTRNDGSPGDRIDTFTYTIRDADGDTDDAILKITIEDDRPVVGENPDVVVDDDALGGNSASTIGDDVDPQNTTGTLSGSGGDGALTWAFQTTGAPAGFQYLASGAGILIQQDQGGTWVTVATVTLDTTDGDYTVTQNNPVIHADGDNENNISVTLNYTVQDVDLDSTPGTLTINFDDDAPTATAEPAQSVGEGGTINGTVDFVEGADGASVTHVNDTALIFGGDGFSQSLDIGNGSIKVKADGTYVFTADNPVVGTGSANATFTITDGDNDVVTATAAFTITDVNKPTGGSASAAVDDDGLTGGNPASTLFDLDANVGDDVADTSEATFTGTLGGSVGPDGAGANGFGFAANTIATIGLETVTYSLSGNVLTARITTSPDSSRIGTDLFKVEITNTATGAYKVTLLDNVLHEGGPNAENSPGLVGPDATTTIALTVTDADGSTAPSSLQITFDDDAPTASPISAVQAVENQSITIDIRGSYAAGADGVDLSKVTWSLPSQGSITYDGNGVFTYTPNPGAGSNGNLADSFLYDVIDGDNDFGTATVTITLKPDSTPTVTVTDVTVDEKGLPNGSGEVANPAPNTDNSETGTGSFSITTGNDGIQAVEVQDKNGNWINVTAATVGTPVIVLGNNGTLTVTSDGAGNYSYSYTLANNLTTHDDTIIGTDGDSDRGVADQKPGDAFAVRVTDTDGDTTTVTATSTINVTVNDDGPNANDDVAGLTEGGSSFVTFDVDTNDVAGADGTASRLFTSLTGVYGNIALNPDGTQTYTLNSVGQAAIDALPPGVTLTDTFSYTLTDGDGDKDPAQLVVTLTGADDPVTITNLTPKANGGDAAVDEDDLPAGSDTIKESLTTTGDFTITAADGVASLTIHGVLVVSNGLFTSPGPIVTPLGNTLTITSYTPATGVITYSYTLNGAETHGSGSGENDLFEDFAVVLTDADPVNPDVANSTLSIRIVDDVPTANADTDSVKEDGPTVANGNVLTAAAVASPDDNATDGVADVRGADGANVTGVVFGSATGPVNGNVGGTVNGTYGTLTLAAGGGYTYTLNNSLPAVQSLSAGQTLTETFTYSITDGDGDPSTTTLTITINGTDDGVVIDGLGGNAEETVFENDLSDGSSPNAPALTQTGTFNVTAVDGLATVVIGGITVVSAGALTGTLTVDTPLGLLTITGFTPTLGAGGEVIGGTVSYSYLLQDNSLAHTLAGPDGNVFDNFPVVVTDVDGSTSNATLNIEIIDDVPTVDIGTSGATLIVDESLGTGGSVQNEGGRANNDETIVGAAVGAIGYAKGFVASLTTANAGADGEASRVYALSVTNSASGLVDAVTNQNIVLVLNGTTVEGRVGAANGALSFTIGVDTATGELTLNQFRSIEHNDSSNHDENNGSEALMSAGRIALGVTITDNDGDTGNDTVDISQAFKFEDDGPLAVAEAGSVNEVTVDYNTAFVLDFSGSIDSTEYATMMNAVKAAISALFDSTSGNVTVRFVPFSGTAPLALASGVFTTEAAALAQLDAWIAARPLNSGTDYTAAIQTLMQVYSADSTAQNRIFFLSDGNPNEQLGSSGQALSDTVRPLWNSFINNAGPNISVTSIGVGSTASVNDSNLQQIDVDGDGDPIIRVTDFDDLIDALTALFPPPTISGDLDLNDDFGTDGGRILSITIPLAGTDATYTWNGVIGAGSVINVTGAGATTINGATSFTATTELGGKMTFNFETGAWSYVGPSTVAATANEVFNYTIVDGDGDTSASALTVTVINDNVPTTTPVTATVDDEGLSGGNLGGTADVDANAGESPASASEAVYNGALGINFGPDGAGSTTFAQLQGTSISVGTETATLTWNAITNVLTATGPRGVIFTVTLTNPSTGAYTVTLVDNVLHSTAVGENDASVALIYRASDGNGTTTTGTLNITFDDDTPNAYSTAPGTATGPNAIATSDTEALNLPGIGADSPGSLAFTTTAGQQVLATSGTALTYNGQNLFYNLSTTDNSVLEARTSATPGAGTLVFTIDLNPAAGATGQYVYTQFQQLSTAVLVPVTNLSSVGGGNVAAKAIDVPGSPFDIVLTTKPGFTVNTNSTQIGIGSGQSLDDSDAIRIDFVNVTVSGGGGGTATFNEYYSANAFRQDVSGLASGQRADFTVRAISIVNNANGQALPADGDTVFYGDTNDTTVTGTTLNIYNAAGVLQTATLLSNAGVQVTNLGGGVWRVLNLPNDYDYEIVSATTPFQAVQLDALVGTDTFKLGVLTTSVLQVQGATFTAPIRYTDSDGDFVNNVITVNLSAPASPVVLDLDGDGAEFVSAAAGVTFDYLGDGSPESTAWIGADDGLLAIDRNGDGAVNDGSEIVFGGDGLTDLQGLAAKYDSNHDGQLTTADDNFALFGVWQDANGNGVAEAGEFKSLSEAGIVSIGLVSDGNAYSAANGDVSVAGQSTYTKADGTTGIVADAAFATGAAQSTSSRSSEQLRTSNVTSSIVAASLVGLAAEISPVFSNWDDMHASELVQFEYQPPVGSFEPFDMAAIQQDFVRTNFAPAQEFVQRIGNVSSSLRAVDEADFAGDLGDALVRQMSDLLGDSAAPHADQTVSSTSAFGGNSVMHNILDMAASGMPAGANDNPAIPLAVEDAVREAMPDMMMDRLVDSFSGEVASSGDAVVKLADNGEMLRGMLDQTIDALHVSPIHNTDLSGSQHYEMNVSNNG